MHRAARGPLRRPGGRAQGGQAEGARVESRQKLSPPPREREGGKKRSMNRDDDDDDGDDVQLYVFVSISYPIFSTKRKFEKDPARLRIIGILERYLSVTINSCSSYPTFRLHSIGKASSLLRQDLAFVLIPYLLHRLQSTLFRPAHSTRSRVGVGTSSPTATAAAAGCSMRPPLRLVKKRNAE